MVFQLLSPCLLLLDSIRQIHSISMLVILRSITVFGMGGVSAGCGLYLVSVSTDVLRLSISAIYTPRLVGRCMFRSEWRAITIRNVQPSALLMNGTGIFLRPTVYQTPARVLQVVRATMYVGS